MQRLLSVGAIAVAGLKKYVDALPTRDDGSKGNFVVISSDASNIGVRWVCVIAM